ncbi:MAG: DUF4845 domain-containing protein [Gammaproteobacteria bacterium]|nr:MAG: DUF4845 domain-containing protein [Gammaproteobacteria bacterium]
MMKQQRGLTAISWMIIIALIAIQGIMALRIIPVYLDFGTVKSVMDNVASDVDSKGKTPKYLLTVLERNLQMNNISDLNRQSGVFEFKPMSDGLQVVINYEVRGPIYGNLDFVATFDYEVVIPKN